MAKKKNIGFGQLVRDIAKARTKKNTSVWGKAKYNLNGAAAFVSTASAGVLDAVTVFSDVSIATASKASDGKGKKIIKDAIDENPFSFVRNAWNGEYRLGEGINKHTRKAFASAVGSDPVIARLNRLKKVKKPSKEIKAAIKALESVVKKKDKKKYKDSYKKLSEYLDKHRLLSNDDIVKKIMKKGKSVI